MSVKTSEAPLWLCGFTHSHLLDTLVMEVGVTEPDKWYLSASPGSVAYSSSLSDDSRDIVNISGTCTLIGFSSSMHTRFACGFRHNLNLGCAADLSTKRSTPPDKLM